MNRSLSIEDIRKLYSLPPEVPDSEIAAFLDRIYLLATFAVRATLSRSM